MRKFTKLAAVKLDDANAERSRDSHATAIGELQDLAMAGFVIAGDLTIPNGGQAVINHKLGRAPRMVILSPPRVEFGTFGLVAGGELVDLTGGGVDRTQQLRILATGYGVAVTVTVAVL